MNRNEKPLTLDELREMNGKPVKYEATGEIFIVELNHPDFGECVINASGYYIPLHRAVDRSMGRRFFDYTQPMIAREAWEPCEYCGEQSPHHDCVIEGNVEQFLCSRDGLFGDAYINTRKIEYCPYCGRPLTDSAWEQLEERLM